MKNDADRFDPSRLPAALKRLAEDLSALDVGDGPGSLADVEMLSLIVNGSLHGDDISRNYPAFYRKLLENPELRQAFLDALESLEDEREGSLSPMPGASRTPLDFLAAQHDSPLVEFPGQPAWRATWQRTLEQLRSIFSPPELAYRADPALSDDLWLTLLREDIVTAGATYAVMLDCALSGENEDSLSLYLNLAVTLDSPSGSAGFPLRAGLRWGGYQADLLIDGEGRFRFPDVPIGSIFDGERSQPRAGFSLVLERSR